MNQARTIFASKCLAEMIGTFVLVFAGTGAIVINDVTHGSVSHVGVGLVFGLVVMAMIYAMGEASGAHLNPAVTIGFCTARRMEAGKGSLYVVSQVTGAILASLAMRGLFPDHATLGATIPSGPIIQSFILEIILTAVLMMVILCVSTGSKEVGIMAGIAIGGTVGLEAIFAGPICGASMNPARSIGPALVAGQTATLWIYVAAPVLGAILGVAAWAGIRPAIQASLRKDVEHG
jgi:MIP family channel proteins